MLMEPDEQQSDFSIIPSESRLLYPYQQQQQQQQHQPQQQSGFRPIFPTYSRTSRISVQESVEQPTSAEQNFFPSFFRESPPLGHSRPYYPVNTERPTGRYYGSGTGQNHGRAVNTFDQAILGSGNFGVIRGGTFYQDNDPAPAALRGGGSEHHNDYYSFYNKNNGHGRPQSAPHTQKQHYGGEDQFANFRDFADINTPNDPAYSEFVVVYANKNSTATNNALYKNPKNIFEQLELLDREKEEEARLSSKQSKKTKKISKFKVKLLATKTEKNYRKKLGPKDLNEEPLLALS
jgi:hypothetical protein